MALVAVAADKGAPGVSTASLALAAVWPRPVLLAEADPAGGDLVYRLPAADGGRLDPRRGLLSLAVAARRGIHPHQVWEHTQKLYGGVDVLTGVANAEQAGGLQLLWGKIGQVLAAIPQLDVVADCGRLGMDGPFYDMLGHASSVVLVARPNLEGVVRLRDRVAVVAAALAKRGQPGAILNVVIVADYKQFRQATAEVGAALEQGNVPGRVVGGLAYEPKSAEMLRGSWGGKLDKSMLIRTAREIAGRLAAELPVLPGSAHPAEPHRPQQAEAGQLRGGPAGEWPAPPAQQHQDSRPAPVPQDPRQLPVPQDPRQVSVPRDSRQAPVPAADSAGQRRPGPPQAHHAEPQPQHAAPPQDQRRERQPPPQPGAPGPIPQDPGPAGPGYPGRPAQPPTGYAPPQPDPRGWPRPGERPPAAPSQGPPQGPDARGGGQPHQDRLVAGPRPQDRLVAGRPQDQAVAGPGQQPGQQQGPPAQSHPPERGAGQAGARWPGQPGAPAYGPRPGPGQPWPPHQPARQASQPEASGEASDQEGRDREEETRPLPVRASGRDGPQSGGNHHAARPPAGPGQTVDRPENRG